MRFWIEIPEETRRLLSRLAMAERRDPREQAVVLIEQALGLRPGLDVLPEPQQPESDGGQ